MSYSPSWTNAGAQGRVTAGSHNIRLIDAEELADAVNRRRLLTYQLQQDFSSVIYSGAPVGCSLVIGATAPPLDSLRISLEQKVLAVSGGGMGGSPSTPTSMDWLWPVADADENKIIVNDKYGVSAGEVGLFSKLNGTGNWTDYSLSAGQNEARAVHFNEMRQAVEWLRRGRWKMPIYLTAGLISVLPDTPWTGGAVVNNGFDELRTAGYVVMLTGETPQRGIVNATVRSSSCLEITVDTNCTIEAYYCLRDVDFYTDQPTWNEYDPSASLAWSAAGGTGPGDANYLGSLALTANTPANLSSSALTAAFQAMVDGGEQSFLFRRSDTGTESVAVSVETVVDFDLDTPPN